MNVVSFDIETVPQENLSEIQIEEVDRKVANYLDKNPKVDLEEARNLIMGTSPFFGEIITIGMYLKEDRYGGQEGSVALVGEEHEILSEFWENLNTFKGLFVSFNGLSFDVPFILKRSMKHKIKPTNAAFLNTYRFQKTPHFDVKEIVSDFDRWNAPTLQLTCDLLGIASPKDGDIKAKEVYAAYKAGRIQEIAAYCERDVKATYLCYKELQGYYK